IRAYAITPSVDDPVSSRNKINDTKAHMPALGMAFPIEHLHDLLTEEFVDHLRTEKGAREFGGQFFSSEFVSFLVRQGAGLGSINTGTVTLRCKPMQGTYGCYGHHRGTIAERDFRSNLKADLKKRGPYVVQVEMDTPTI